MAEYVILLVLISLGVILAVRYYGGSVKGQISGATGEIDLIGQGGKRSVKEQYESRRYAADEGTSRATSAQESDTTGQEDYQVRPGEGEDYAQAVSRLHKGVGDDRSKSKAVEEIQLSFSTLLLLAGGICGGGVLLLLLSRRGRSKEKKKKKRKKRRWFTLGDRDEKGE
jgi:hypothetical protein